MRFLKKCWILSLVMLCFVACGRNAGVDYGGYYKLEDADVILLAVGPKLQAEMGLGDYDCENCAKRWNSNCNHLSAPISLDSPEFAQLPEEVRDAALQFQAEPPDPRIGNGTSLSFQLTRFSYDYLKSIHKKLYGEWSAAWLDTESFWNTIDDVKMFEDRNTVVFFCTDFIHTAEKDVETQELAAYLQKTEIDMRALRVRHEPVACEDLSD